jgi:hypothetical protein
MTVSTSSDTRTKTTERTVCLRGITPIMFDRYPGDNNTKLDWWQKVYLRPGSNVVCLPTMNIVSFFSSHNTNSAPKRLRDKRKYKDIANACLSFVMIRPMDDSDGDMIPLLRNGKPIEMGTPEVDHDKKSGMRLHRAVARLDKGIPNPKERPMLPCPWEIRFRIQILPNREIKEQEIRNLMDEGGMAIGLGTFRGVFGKFEITEWA